MKHTPEMLDSLREMLDLVEGAFGEHFDPDINPCSADSLCRATDCMQFGCVTNKIIRARAQIAKAEAAALTSPDGPDAS